MIYRSIMTSKIFWLFVGIVIHVNLHSAHVASKGVISKPIQKGFQQRFIRGVAKQGIGTAEDILFTSVGYIPTVLAGGVGAFNWQLILASIVIKRALAFGGITGILQKVPHVGAYLPVGAAGIITSKVTTGSWSPLSAVQSVSLSLLMGKLVPYIMQKSQALQQEYGDDSDFQVPVQKNPRLSTNVSQKKTLDKPQAAVAVPSTTLFITQLGKADSQLSAKIDDVAQILYSKTAEQVLNTDSQLNRLTQEQIQGVQLAAKDLMSMFQKARDLIPHQFNERYLLAQNLQQTNQFAIVQQYITNINQSLWYCGMFYRMFFMALGKEHELTRAFDLINPRHTIQSLPVAS